MKKNRKKLYLQQKKRYLKAKIQNLDRPRLAVFRSHKHIYAQLINDVQGKTLAFSSTLNKEVLAKLASSATKSSNKQAAFFVGEHIAKEARSKNISTIVFDRRNRPYHGRIQSLAEGARNQGLLF
jgi:large subunit ribosomal protein L18